MGDRVRIACPKAKTSGRTGVVERWIAAKKRFLVTLDGDEQRQVRFLPKKLEKVRATGWVGLPCANTRC